MASYAELLDDLVALQFQDEPKTINGHSDPICTEATALDLVMDGDVHGLRVWLDANPQININARHPETGRSILHQASADGQKEIVKLLLENTEANLALRTMLGGSTALHLAVTNNHRSIAFQLLSHGADALTRDKFGCAPMHYVKSLSVAKLLVLYGGKVLDYNSRRKSAMDSVTTTSNGGNQAPDVPEDDHTTWKELLQFLKATAETEYKAKLAKLRELKQRAKLQQDELLATQKHRLQKKKNLEGRKVVQ